MARSIVFIIGILICFSLNAQQTTVFTEANKHYKEGIDLYDQGLFGPAQKEFKAVMDASPTVNEGEYALLHSNAQLYFAKCAVRMEQPDGENLILQFIREHDPAPVAAEATKEMADYYYNAREYEQAIRFYNMLSITDLTGEERSEVQFKKGYCHFVKKEFSRARSIFKTIIDDQNQYYYPANYYYGMTCFFDGNYECAVESFRRVEASRKYRDHVPYYLTQIYFAQGDMDKVISYGEQKVEEWDVRNAKEIHQLIGQAYFERKNYRSALPHLEYYNDRSRKMREEDFYQLAYTQYKTGNYEDAAENFTELSNVDSELGQFAMYNLADCYLHLGDKEAARNAFRQAYKMKYDGSIREESLFRYGKLSYELGFDRDAIQAFQAVKTTSKYYSESQDLLSKTFLNTRDYEKALATIEGMQDKTPAIREAYQKLAYMQAVKLFNERKYAAAKDYLNKSLDFPIDAVTKAMAYYWLGEIAHAEGEYDRSKSELNKFFALQNRTTPWPEQKLEHTGNYTMGYNYIKQSNYTTALTFFNKTVQGIRKDGANIDDDFVKNQVYADALLRAGDCYFKKNNYSEALQRYNEVYNSKYVGYVYAIYQKAIIHGLRGNTVEKILGLEEVSEQHPESQFADDALLQLGITYQEIGKYDLAVKPLLKLVQDYKNQSDLVVQAYLRLGLIAYNQGLTDDAIRYYKEVFNNNPDKKQANDALAALEEIYIEDLGRPDDYTRFVESIPGYNLTNVARDSINFKSAESQYENGNYQRAVTAFGEYLRRFPKGLYTLNAHYYRGESFAVLKQFEEALDDYEYVVNRGPSKFYDKALYKAAALAYNVAEDFDKAFRYYSRLETVANTEERRFEAQMGALRAAYRINNTQAVYEMARKVKNNPRAGQDEKAAANFYLGKVAYDRDDYDSALDAFNEVVKLSPNSEAAAEARYLVAHIYYLRRELDIAFDLSKESQNSSYHYWVAKSVILMADILAEKGDIFNAKAVLEGLLENYDEDPELVRIAREKLERLNEIEETQNRLQEPEKDGLLELEESDEG